MSTLWAGLVAQHCRCVWLLSSGDPEASVPVQQNELPSVQRAVLHSPGGGRGAEGAHLAARHRQHPDVSVPAGTFPQDRPAPGLLLRLHQHRDQSVSSICRDRIILSSEHLSSVFFALSSDSPYALIVRRYLSLLDAAIELEYRDYTGPRLQDAHKVLMFDRALTADEVNRKYR